MSTVAEFLKRFAKPEAKPLTRPADPIPSAFAPGSIVALDGVEGVVAYVDGDRVVWADDEGAIHMTLPKFLETR